MATVEQTLTKVWVDVLAPGVRDALIEQDRIFEMIRSSSMGVAPADEIGRDWTVKHQYITSLAGKLRATTMPGDAIYGATTDPVQRVGATFSTYPTLAGQILPGYVNTSITLKRWKGNTFIPRQFLQADTLSSLITRSSAAILKQTARMVAAWKANLFFSTDTTHRSVGTVGVITGSGNGVDGDGSATAIGVKFTIGSSDRIRRFQPGMEVDIYKTDTTLRNASACFVHSVDPLTNTVIIGFVDGASTWTTQVVATDVIVLHSSRTFGPSGLEDWLKNSGTLLGGIDLDTKYPQFKSYIVSNLGHSLTEQDLRKWIGGVIDAWGPSKAPDTLLTTQGVLNAYIGETDDVWRYDLQSTPLRKEGGFILGSYNYNGRSLMWKASALVAAKTLYGLRMKNNFRRYVPPRTPRTARNSYFNGDIEFVAPLGGLQGIWKHVTSSDALTDWAEAPFDSVEEYAPEVPQGVKIGGITEETIV